MKGIRRYGLLMGLVLAVAACGDGGGANVDNGEPGGDVLDASGAPDGERPEDERSSPPDGLGRQDLIDIWNPFDVPPPPDVPDTQTVDFQGPDVQDAGTEELAAEGTHIADLQQAPESQQCAVLFGSMLVGMDIVLKKVVVTAPAYPYQFVGGKLDGFYVQDVGGGKWSGIHAAYDTDKLPALAPGMVLTLVGDHKEAFCFTVFVAKSVLVEGEGGPAPEALATTPAEIAAEPEAFEGVLVTLSAVTVTSANPDADEGLDDGQFQVDDVLRVGNDYQLAYMNPNTDARQVGDVFVELTGVVKFVDEQFVLMPRMNSDMWLEGEQPPVDEEPVEYVEPVPDVVESPAEVVEQVEPFPDVVEEVDTWEVIEDTGPDVPEDPDVPVEPDLPAEDIQPDIPLHPDSPLVITEIMYNPDAIPDDKGEWFEVTNAGEEAIDLNGWRIEDDKGAMHIIMYGGPFVIAPGQSYVFGSNAIESTNGGVEITYQYPYVDFQMGNLQGAVVLKNIYGEAVDSVHYDTAAGFPNAKGASLELIHPNLDNENPDHWQLATQPYGDGSNLGTPGTAPN